MVVVVGAVVERVVVGAVVTGVVDVALELPVVETVELTEGLLVVEGDELVVEELGCPSLQGSSDSRSSA